MIFAAPNLMRPRQARGRILRNTFCCTRALERALSNIFFSVVWLCSDSAACDASIAQCKPRAQAGGVTMADPIALLLPDLDQMAFVFFVHFHEIFDGLRQDSNGQP